jgi:hypothetical protein
MQGRRLQHFRSCPYSISDRSCQPAATSSWQGSPRRVFLKFHPCANLRPTGTMPHWERQGGQGRGSVSSMAEEASMAVPSGPGHCPTVTHHVWIVRGVGIDHGVARQGVQVSLKVVVVQGELRRRRGVCVCGGGGGAGGPPPPWTRFKPKNRKACNQQVGSGPAFTRAGAGALPVMPGTGARRCQPETWAPCRPGGCRRGASSSAGQAAGACTVCVAESLGAMASVCLPARLDALPPPLTMAPMLVPYSAGMVPVSWLCSTLNCSRVSTCAISLGSVPAGQGPKLHTQRVPRWRVHACLQGGCGSTRRHAARPACPAGQAALLRSTRASPSACFLLCSLTTHPSAGCS